MVTFLHTADWQIGMTRRWLQGEAQARFTAARVEAIRSLGRVADQQGCEFVVVCGDVFEANQLSGQTVRRALEALREVPVPVYLLPGNHDPLDALSIYRSPLFLAECPAHVHVLDTPGPTRVREGVELLAAPWESKHPGEDLVARAVATAGMAVSGSETVDGTVDATGDGRRDGTVRIVVGHGAVDVLDPDRANPATIALAGLEEAVRSGRIHYVALGDRHSRTAVGTTGAVWYSGAPEVTDHREELPGDVLVVRVEPGSPPEVQPHHVGTWHFRTLSREMSGAADVTALDAELSSLPAKERTVVRLALRGTLGLADGARLESLLAGHGEVLAALDDWQRHSDLRVLADGAELRELGLGGFLATAAEEIRHLAAHPSGVTPGAESHGVTEGGADDELDWRPEPTRADDADSAADALSLLYRFTREGSLEGSLR